MIHASCHCGAVELAARRKPARLVSCNCSICRRYGALWAYYSVRSISRQYGPDAVVSYRWGDKSIDFMRCKACGCLTHYESADKSGNYRIALNARMMPPVAVAGVRIRHFDGADSWTYSDRPDA